MTKRLIGKLTPILPMRTGGYRFYFIKGNRKLSHFYNTRLEALIAHDEIIEKERLDQTKRFPLKCVIPKKYCVKINNHD